MAPILGGSLLVIFLFKLLHLTFVPCPSRTGQCLSRGKRKNNDSAVGMKISALFYSVFHYTISMQPHSFCKPNRTERAFLTVSLRLPVIYVFETEVWYVVKICVFIHHLMEVYLSTIGVNQSSVFVLFIKVSNFIWPLWHIKIQF